MIQPSASARRHPHRAHRFAPGREALRGSVFHEREQPAADLFIPKLMLAQRRTLDWGSNWHGSIAGPTAGIAGMPRCWRRCTCRCRNTEFRQRGGRALRYRPPAPERRSAPEQFSSSTSLLPKYARAPVPQKPLSVQWIAGGASAPAVPAAAPQQRGEHQPGRDRQHGLVHEVPRRGCRERRTRQQRQRQRPETGTDHPEQQRPIVTSGGSPREMPPRRRVRSAVPAPRAAATARRRARAARGR